MLRATVRGLLAHKVRLLLTAVAVVLGVAFVTGSLVFTDTLGKTFDDLFTQTTPDVVVTPQNNLAQGGAGQDGAVLIPSSVLTIVQSVPGVERARGVVFVNGVQVTGQDGKVIGQAGAPAFGTSWSDDQDLSPFRLVEGRGPTRPGEVAVDSQTATKAGLHVGGPVVLTTPGPTRHDTVVGIFRFGTTGNLAGASIVAFDLRTAQLVLVQGAHGYTQVSAKGAAGTSQELLRNRVVEALGSQGVELKVQTGKAAADEQAKRITDGLQFFNVFLLVFAGIALVVGSFIILNTFTMLVAQRTRELALLRAIGATRRQVTRSVLLEALAVGVVGATIGLGLGVLLSSGLRGLFAALGIDLPAGPLVLAGRTVLAAYVVGIGVTLVAAYLPARRASRVPPVAALRVDASPTARSLRMRTLLGCVVLAVGLLTAFAGLRSSGDRAPSLVGLGGLGVLVGAVVLSPSISRHVIGWLAAPVRASGATGKIAVDNARRNPRRTATTASALMLGLALVSAIGVLGASTTASTDAVIDNVVRADFIASNPSFLPLSPEVAQTLARTPGVGTVSPVQALRVQIGGNRTGLTAVDPATITAMVDLAMVSGSVQGLGVDGLLVDDKTATTEHYRIGSRIPVTFETGPRVLTVQGVYKSSGAFSGGVVSVTTARQVGARNLDEVVYVRVAAGADPAKTRAAVDRAMAGFPNVKVQDQTEFKASIRDQVNQLLYIVYALLGLAVVIAVLGIVNTLALSVVERTREIGLLRALGMGRRQLRTTVRLESVSISVYGALLGLVIGVAFGTALQRSLVEQGITVLGIPWAVLVVVLLASVVVGVLAAVWPARRAAKLDVLAAITTE
ncbi:MAG: ABC transporter permease [Actinomycetes bacterium]